VGREFAVTEDRDFVASGKVQVTRTVWMNYANDGSRRFLFPAFAMKSARWESDQELFDVAGVLTSPAQSTTLVVKVSDLLRRSRGSQQLRSVTLENHANADPDLDDRGWFAVLSSSIDDHVYAKSKFDRQTASFEVRFAIPRGELTRLTKERPEQLRLSLTQRYPVTNVHTQVRANAHVAMESIERLRGSLGSVASKPCDLVFIGGSASQRREVIAGLTTTATVSVLTHPGQAADKRLVTMLLDKLLSLAQSQINVKQEQASKVATVLFGDVLRVTAPVGNLSSVLHKTKDEIERRIKDTNTSTAGLTAPIGGVTFGANFSSTAERERAMHDLAEMERSLQGTLPVLTGIRLDQVLDDARRDGTNFNVALGTFNSSWRDYVFVANFSSITPVRDPKRFPKELEILQGPVSSSMITAQRVVLKAGSTISVPDGDHQRLRISAGTLVIEGAVTFVGKGYDGSRYTNRCPVAARDPRVDFQCHPWRSCCGSSQAKDATSPGPNGASGPEIEISYLALQGSTDDISISLAGGSGGQCPGGQGALCRNPHNLGYDHHYPGNGNPGPMGNAGAPGKMSIVPLED